MANQPIRPGALAAAAVVGVGLTYYMIDKNRRCSTFSKVWADPAGQGLHLKPEAIDDAQHWTREKLRSILFAQETPNRAMLHSELATYMADCDWESARKGQKGRQVWDSLGGIINIVMTEYNNDPTGFMKG